MEVSYFLTKRYLVAAESLYRTINRVLVNHHHIVQLVVNHVYFDMCSSFCAA